MKEHSQARLQVASHEALAVAQQQGLAPEARAYDDTVETSSVAYSSNLRKPSRCPPPPPGATAHQNAAPPEAEAEAEAETAAPDSSKDWVRFLDTQQAPGAPIDADARSCLSAPAEALPGPEAAAAAAAQDNLRWEALERRRDQAGSPGAAPVPAQPGTPRATERRARERRKSLGSSSPSKPPGVWAGQTSDLGRSSGKTALWNQLAAERERQPSNASIRSRLSIGARNGTV